MTSHSDAAATDNTRAAVASTVATVGGGVGDGAVATVSTDTVIDGTAVDTGTMKKQNFHTGLDPVSRTKNSAQPTEFNAAADTVTVVGDETIVTDGGENKIVIPAGSGNPDARTAR